MGLPTGRYASFRSLVHERWPGGSPLRAALCAVLGVPPRSISAGRGIIAPLAGRRLRQGEMGLVLGPRPQHRACGGLADTGSLAGP